MAKKRGINLAGLDAEQEKKVEEIVNAAPLREVHSVQNDKKKNVTIVLRQSDIDEMQDFCVKAGISRSSLIRLAVAEYIHNH